MDSVRQVHIERAGRAPHASVARSPAAVGVRPGVFALTVVRLDLSEAHRNIARPEDRPEEARSHLESGALRERRPSWLLRLSGQKNFTPVANE